MCKLKSWKQKKRGEVVRITETNNRLYKDVIIIGFDSEQFVYQGKKDFKYFIQNIFFFCNEKGVYKKALAIVTKPL